MLASCSASFLNQISQSLGIPFDSYFALGALREERRPRGTTCVIAMARLVSKRKA